MTVPGPIDQPAYPMGSFMSQLPAYLRTEVLEVGVERHYRAGEVLPHGDGSTMMLRRGVAQTEQFTGEGYWASHWDSDQVAVSYVGPGDLLDEPYGALQPALTQPILRVVFKADSVVHQFNSRAFTRLATANVEVTRAIAAAMLTKYNRELLYRSWQSTGALRRVRLALHDLAERFGTDHHRSGYGPLALIDFDLPQADLGLLLGLSTGSVDSAIRSLRQEREIWTGYRRIAVRSRRFKTPR